MPSIKPSLENSSPYGNIFNPGINNCKKLKNNEISSFVSSDSLGSSCAHNIFESKYSFEKLPDFRNSDKVEIFTNMTKTKNTAEGPAKLTGLKKILNDVHDCCKTFLTKTYVAIPGLVFVASIFSLTALTVLGIIPLAPILAFVLISPLVLAVAVHVSEKIYFNVLGKKLEKEKILQEDKGRTGPFAAHPTNIVSEFWKNVEKTKD